MCHERIHASMQCVEGGGGGSSVPLAMTIRACNAGGRRGDEERREE